MNETTPQVIDLGPKRRHGCLTAWLILLIIINPLSGLVYLVTIDSFSDSPSWFIPAMIVFSLINFAGALALLKWKKWGFWAILAVNLVLFFINFTLVGFGGAISGLLGFSILFFLLNLGGENQAWTKLE